MAAPTLEATIENIQATFSTAFYAATELFLFCKKIFTIPIRQINVYDPLRKTFQEEFRVSVIIVIVKVERYNFEKTNDTRFHLDRVADCYCNSWVAHVSGSANNVLQGRFNKSQNSSSPDADD